MIKKVRAVNNEFSGYVEKSVQKLKVPKNIYVEAYLTSVLSRFATKDGLLVSDEPLVFRLFNSKSLDDYVNIGEETLFVTGFFPEILLKDKNKRYVTNIGRGAYMRAAVMLDYKGEGHVYAVLSQKFNRYSNVINEVRYNMLEKIDDKELLMLYNMWNTYKNPKALEKLKQAGIHE